jgi:hypothetical protein
VISSEFGCCSQILSSGTFQSVAMSKNHLFRDGSNTRRAVLNKASRNTLLEEHSDAATACFKCDRAACNATKNKFIACSSLYVLRVNAGVFSEAMRRPKLSLAFQAVSEPSRRMWTGIKIRGLRPWLRNTSASLFGSNRCRNSNCMKRKGA